MTACVTCAAPTKGRSPHGLCRKCAAPLARQAWRRTFDADPTIREKFRQIGLAVGARPDIIEQRRQRAKAQRLDQIGRAARTAESFAKGGRAFTERTIGDIPPELRAEYRRLRGCKFSREEAKAILLDQHERDLARFRARIGG